METIASEGRTGLAESIKDILKGLLEELRDHYAGWDPKHVVRHQGPVGKHRGAVCKFREGDKPVKPIWLNGNQSTKLDKADVDDEADMDDEECIDFDVFPKEMPGRSDETDPDPEFGLYWDPEEVFESITELAEKLQCSELKSAFAAALESAFASTVLVSAVEHFITDVTSKCEEDEFISSDQQCVESDEFRKILLHQYWSLQEIASSMCKTIDQQQQRKDKIARILEEDEDKRVTDEKMQELEDAKIRLQELTSHLLEARRIEEERTKEPDPPLLIELARRNAEKEAALVNLTEKHDLLDKRLKTFESTLLLLEGSFHKPPDERVLDTIEEVKAKTRKEYVVPRVRDLEKELASTLTTIDSKTIEEKERKVNDIQTELRDIEARLQRLPTLMGRNQRRIQNLPFKVTCPVEMWDSEDAQNIYPGIVQLLMEAHEGIDKTAPEISKFEQFLTNAKNSFQVLSDFRPRFLQHVETARKSFQSKMEAGSNEKERTKLKNERLLKAWAIAEDWVYDSSEIMDERTSFGAALALEEGKSTEDLLRLIQKKRWASQDLWKNTVRPAENVLQAAKTHTIFENETDMGTELIAAAEVEERRNHHGKLLQAALALGSIAVHNSRRFARESSTENIEKIPIEEAQPGLDAETAEQDTKRVADAGTGRLKKSKTRAKKRKSDSVGGPRRSGKRSTKSSKLLDSPRTPDTRRQSKAAISSVSPPTSSTRKTLAQKDQNNPRVQSPSSPSKKNTIAKDMPDSRAQSSTLPTKKNQAGKEPLDSPAMKANQKQASSHLVKGARKSLLVSRPVRITGTQAEESQQALDSDPCSGRMARPPPLDLSDDVQNAVPHVDSAVYENMSPLSPHTHDSPSQAESAQSPQSPVSSAPVRGPLTPKDLEKLLAACDREDFREHTDGGEEYGTEVGVGTVGMVRLLHRKNLKLEAKVAQGHAIVDDLLDYAGGLPLSPDRIPDILGWNEEEQTLAGAIQQLIEERGDWLDQRHFAHSRCAQVSFDDGNTKTKEQCSFEKTYDRLQSLLEAHGRKESLEKEAKNKQAAKFLKAALTLQRGYRQLRCRILAARKTNLSEEVESAGDPDFASEEAELFEFKDELMGESLGEKSQEFADYTDLELNEGPERVCES